MYIVLTDIMVCPRCESETGLILLADQIVERRIVAGSLGCPGCRTSYPIVDGFADLRSSSEGTSVTAGSESSPDAGSRDAAFRLAALMGITEGPGAVLVAGGAGELAVEIAGLVKNLEVVAVGVGPGGAGVSRVGASGRLPFLSGSMRAVAFTGAAAEEWLEEGTRVLAPVGRMVLEAAPEAVEERLRELGLDVVAAEGRTIVAERRAAA